MELQIRNFLESTWLQGNINATYKSLVELLGEPNGKTDGYKVDIEWELLINGKPMTIYNWKNGKNYLGNSGMNIEDITDWHIGGNCDLLSEIEWLKNKLSEL